MTLSPHLWAPQRRGIELTIDALQSVDRVCLYSPTGGGKTTQAIELFKFVETLGWTGAFYVNRTLLVGQTAQRFKSAGLTYGIRAAGYEDEYRLDAPFQVCSADTERSRVYERKIWARHPARLVIVDEAHIQKSETMRKILSDYRSEGAKVVLLTATPIGLSNWADELVVSGRLAEYRACQALVPAIVKSIEQPDLRKVTRNATGEYVIDGEKKRIYTQSIVANVMDRWKRYNPDARPTMLYAPGVPESVWFTEQFMKLGVNWCHVDATDAVVDGKRVKLTRPLWEEIIERFKSGDIKGLSSRLKLREGIDVPNTYHCILATPIGSLASYIQTVGRVLRYSPSTPDHVLVTDHGGNYLRHGSPNHDRNWEAWWRLPERVVSEMHTALIRDRAEPEPIRCPKCEGERKGGPKCPHCGHEHAKSQRHVIMADGEMRTVDGELIKPIPTKRHANTEELWRKMFFGFRLKRSNQTFNQMYAFFCKENGYFPPRDLPFMPTRPEGWYEKPYQIEMRNLRKSPEFERGTLFEGAK